MIVNRFCSLRVCFSESETWLGKILANDACFAKFD